MDLPRSPFASRPDDLQIVMTRTPVWWLKSSLTRCIGVHVELATAITSADVWKLEADITIGAAIIPLSRIVERRLAFIFYWTILLVTHCHPPGIRLE
jgi:hypothetical protein